MQHRIESGDKLQLKEIKKVFRMQCAMCVEKVVFYSNGERTTFLWVNAADPAKLVHSKG